MRGNRQELRVTDPAKMRCPRWLPGVIASTAFFEVLYLMVVGQESHRASRTKADMEEGRKMRHTHRYRPLSGIAAKEGGEKTEGRAKAQGDQRG
jgi:hypothetical protein